MAVVLSQETEKLIEERQAQLGVKSADDLVRYAVEAFVAHLQDGDEPFDEETLAAIEEGLAQADRGEGIPLETVMADFEKRFKEAEALKSK